MSSPSSEVQLRGQEVTDGSRPGSGLSGPTDVDDNILRRLLDLETRLKQETDQRTELQRQLAHRDLASGSRLIPFGESAGQPLTTRADYDCNDRGLHDCNYRRQAPTTPSLSVQFSEYPPVRPLTDRAPPSDRPTSYAWGRVERMESDVAEGITVQPGVSQVKGQWVPINF